MYYKTPLFRFLDTNGDGTGTKAALGDYSLASEEFKIEPSTNEEFHIYRFVVILEDIANIDADNYGNGNILTNGISVGVRDASGLKFDLLDGLTVKTNSEWRHFLNDVEIQTYGTGNEHLIVSWDFSKTGQPIILHGDEGEYLAVTVNDDLSVLVDHKFMVQGFNNIQEY